MLRRPWRRVEKKCRREQRRGEVGEGEGWKEIYIKNINHTEAENKMMFGILVH